MFMWEIVNKISSLSLQCIIELRSNMVDFIVSFCRLIFSCKISIFMYFLVFSVLIFPIYSTNCTDGTYTYTPKTYVDSNNDTIFSCQYSSGYYAQCCCLDALVSGTGTSSCLQCNAAYLKECTKCVNGKGVNDSYQCIDCPSPCLQCSTSISACTLCSDPYGVNFSTGGCKYCDDNHCISCANNASRCIACSSGYGVVASNKTCKQCQPSRCVQCSADYTYCTSCKEKYRPSNGNCILCVPLSSNCAQCTNFQSNCSECKEGYDFNDAGICTKCNQNQCAKCLSSNLWHCKRCIKGYGVNKSSHRCVDCNQTECLICGIDYVACTLCNDTFGVFENLCVPCFDTWCIRCAVQANNCTLCIDLYGINTNTNSCNICADSNCQECRQDYTVCTSCKDNFGFDHSLNDNKCYPCKSPCFNCTNINYEACTTCIQAYALLGFQCIPCPSGCKSCLNISYCTLCYPKHYHNLTDFLCYPCTQFCLNCNYNLTNDWSNCLQCQTYFDLTTTLPRKCQQKCGDVHVIVLPCDNGYGIENDGCSDNCTVEDGFTCRVVNNQSTCSYNKQLEMTILTCKRNTFLNEFNMTVKVLPPLRVFETSDITQVFKIKNSAVHIISLTYDNQTNIVSLTATFSDDILTQELTVEFIPNEGVDQRYFDSKYTSTSVGVLFYFYPAFVIQFTALESTLSLAIVAIGAVCCLSSLFIKRLAGLEIMVVVQFAFFTLVWMNQMLLPIYSEAYPLKYATGYNLKNLDFLGINTPPSNQTTRLLADGNAITTLSTKYPHVKPFQIDSNLILNNFNISFLLQFIPFLATLILFLPLKCIYYVKSKIIIKDDEEESENVIKKKKLEKVCHKLEKVRKFSLQWLMYWSIFNIVSFVNFVYIVFIWNRRFKNTLNCVVVALTLFLYVFVFFLFKYDPDPFDYFRYAFKRERPAIFQYYFYSLAIFCTAILICSLPNVAWASLLPFSILFIYTLIYKPYRQHKENYRSCLSMLIILSFLSIRMYRQYFLKETANSHNMYIFQIVNISFLLFLSLATAISLIYYLVYKYYILPRLQKSSKEKVMMELENMDVCKKMKNVDSNDSIFRKLIKSRLNIMDFSNKMHDQFNGKYEVNQMQQDDMLDCAQFEKDITQSQREALLKNTNTTSAIYQYMVQFNHTKKNMENIIQQLKKERLNVSDTTCTRSLRETKISDISPNDIDVQNECNDRSCGELRKEMKEQVQNIEQVQQVQSLQAGQKQKQKQQELVSSTKIKKKMTKQDMKEYMKTQITLQIITEENKYVRLKHANDYTMGKKKDYSLALKNESNFISAYTQIQ